MRSNRWINLGALVAVVVAAVLVVARNVDDTTSNRLLNVSYDPTRELYASLNPQFVAAYARETGRHLDIRQSHGGSSRQARSVIDGQQPADVVTLGLSSDIEALHKRGLVAKGWAARLPNHSQPYTSTIVFVVRSGNPKSIHDWPDLIRPGVEIITPDPKTSGNGKLSALAAWGAVIVRGGSEAEARDYLRAFYQHTPVLDAGARGSATRFALQEIGDVHLTWENEAIREAADAKGGLEIIYPPVSILAEPHVAWVDANVARHGTADAARAYLEFLFTDAAQETIAQLGYRPIRPAILARHADRLPPTTLFPVTVLAASWDDAQQKFFAENGIIDMVTGPRP